MRKKHQSVHISTYAKKSFCSEINLGDYTSDMEIKDHLTNYFNDVINANSTNTAGRYGSLTYPVD